jgi:DNA polymerase-3 subunit gamma/tau
MLPDARAAIAALVAAVGLLMAGFGVAATFRVAQESRPSPLQAARSALLAEPPPRDMPGPVMAQEDAAPASADNDNPGETASVAPPVASPPVEPAPLIAAPAPAPAIVAAAPAASPSDTPETTGTVALVPHADAPAAALPAPAAAPPTGGPLEQAALTPASTPEVKPVVNRKPRAAVKKPRVDPKKARAKAAAKKKRVAAERARRVGPARQPQQSAQPWTGFNQ